MEDFAGKIQDFLSNPNALGQIQEVMATLGLQDGEQPDLGGIFGDTTESAPTENLLRAALPLLGAGGGNNDSRALLLALRPFLSASRQKRIDEAAQIVKMLDLLPLLKQSGLLAGLGGDNDRP